MKNNISEFETCPNCEEPKHLDLQECPYCGVIYKKVQPKDSGPQAPVDLELVEVWQELIADYTNQEKHELFLQKSLAKNKLPFASQQYRKLLEIDHSDEMAKKMQEKIIQLATIKIMSEYRPKSENKKSWLSRFLLLLALMAAMMAVIFKSPAGFLVCILFAIMGLLTKNLRKSV